MNIHETAGFKADFDQLPTKIQKKYRKQIKLLTINLYYPSLHTKKIQGQIDIWEARVDLQYRFRFIKQNEEIFLIAIGPHDIGLGKK